MKGRYVGIVYGPGNSPLYCERDGNYYYVINGNYHFPINSKFINGHPFRIVLEDMEYYADYNEACKLIVDAVESEYRTDIVPIEAYEIKQEEAESSDRAGLHDDFALSVTVDNRYVSDPEIIAHTIIPMRGGMTDECYYEDVIQHTPSKEFLQLAGVSEPGVYRITLTGNIKYQDCSTLDCIDAYSYCDYVLIACHKYSSKEAEICFSLIPDPTSDVS